MSLRPRPIAFFHGFTGRGAAWKPVVRRLLAFEPTIEAWAPDLPGHQGEEPVANLPGSFEATVDLLAQRMTKAHRTPTHLVGYSLGGRLALGLALRHPSLVSALTLVGARPGLDAATRDRRSAEDAALAESLERGGLEAFLEGWRALPLFASQGALPRSVLDRQEALRRSHAPGPLAWALRTLSPGRMPDFRPRLGELTVPVHLVVGELDAPYRALATEMLSALPGGALTVAPGCGHNVPLEAPDFLADALLEARTRDPESAFEEAP